MTGTVCHMSATDVIEAAQSQIGYKEGRSNGYWNNDQKYSRAVPGLGWSNWQPWCATFVCWTFYRTGQLALLPEVSASCDVMMNGWKRKGRWQNAPVLGAQIFFGRPGDAQHTGVVVAYDSKTVTTIEGNTNNTGSYNGNGVYRKTYHRSYSRILGYGIPDYPKPKPKPKPKPVEKPKPNANRESAKRQAQHNVRHGRKFEEIQRPLVLHLEQEAVQWMLDLPAASDLTRRARHRAKRNIRNGIPLKKTLNPAVRKAMLQTIKRIGNL